MKALLSYGLNFIEHVDCGRKVSMEAYKVLASEMGIILSCKHGEANGNICNLR